MGRVRRPKVESSLPTYIYIYIYMTATDFYIQYDKGMHISYLVAGSPESEASWQLIREPSLAAPGPSGDPWGWFLFGRSTGYSRLYESWGNITSLAKS